MRPPSWSASASGSVILNPPPQSLQIGLDLVVVAQQSPALLGAGHTTLWSAPEILEDATDRTDRRSLMSEVYALGIVCSEVLTRQPAFHELVTTRGGGRSAVIRDVIVADLRPALPADIPHALGNAVRDWCATTRHRAPQNSSLTTN